MSQLAVELSDLRGWSRQVGRAGTDCAGLSSYLSAHVPDGDFGAILELVTHEYEGLIPAFTSVLGEEGVRLGATATSLGETADDFQETDARVAQDFGVGRAITDDLRADGFYDVAGGAHTPDEREQLHRDALEGRLGPDMERLARLIEDGETRWGEVFEASSPHAELLHSRLETMEQRYAEEWKQALEDDPTFDPRTVEAEMLDQEDGA